MVFPKSWFSRRCRRHVCCLSLWLAAGAHAQQYAPVVEDRFDTAVVQPAPPIEEVTGKRDGWELGAIISLAYDDNIFLSASNPESDAALRAAPSMAYRKGDSDPWTGEGAFISAAYRPTVVVYGELSSENRLDHEALLSAGWHGKAIRVAYAGVLRKLGDATAETGRPTDRIEFANEARVAWQARGKVALELAAGNRRTEYEDPIYFDSDKTYGEVALRYVYSPKTELGLIYQAGRFKVDGSGTQHTHQLAGAIAWQPREKIRVLLEAGAEHRRTDVGTDLNPVVEGRLEWQPRKETGVFVGAYAREEASAFFAGQNYSVRGFTAGIDQRLGGDWSARLEGGLEKNDYQRVSGTGLADRRDRIWFLRPALVRRIGGQSELSLFYRISDNDSSDAAFGYDQRTFGVELNHKF